MKRTAKETFARPVEVALSGPLRQLRDDGQSEGDIRLFTFGACRCMIGSSVLGWHLSVSCRDRYPTWDELAHAREHLLPRDAHFALIFPPPEEYVNLSENVFHLWQVQPTRGQPMIVPGMIVDANGNLVPRELLARTR